MPSSDLSIPLSWFVADDDVPSNVNITEAITFTAEELCGFLDVAEMKPVHMPSRLPGGRAVTPPHDLSSPAQPSEASTGEPEDRKSDDDFEHPRKRVRRGRSPTPPSAPPLNRGLKRSSQRQIE